MDDLDDRNLRRQAWRERREFMEAQPSGKRWRGQVRSQLYGTVWRVHHVLRPTR